MKPDALKEVACYDIKTRDMARFTRIVNTIDSHTAGEPTRLVVSGSPPLRGDSMAEKMLYARRELDGIRRLLVNEPRGRQDMYGALLATPADPAADFGLVFMNTQQYTTMCGHAVIGAATTVVETGMVQAVEPETRVVFDTPVGLITTRVRVQDGDVVDVSFRNTPVFVDQLDAVVTDSELGSVSMDIVYSGGFFGLVSAEQVGLELISANAGLLAELGVRLRRAVNDQLTVQHSQQPFVTAIDAIEFHEPVEPQPDGALLARNVATFGDRTIDRSPCGTGTCARMAVLYAKGALEIGQRFVSESMIGTRFSGHIVGETHVGGFPAIIPEVAGRAYVTGFHQFVLDADDPFPQGFSLMEAD